MDSLRFLAFVAICGLFVVILLNNRALHRARRRLAEPHSEALSQQRLPISLLHYLAPLLVVTLGFLGKPWALWSAAIGLGVSIGPGNMWVWHRLDRAGLPREFRRLQLIAQVLLQLLLGAWIGWRLWVQLPD